MNKHSASFTGYKCYETLIASTITTIAKNMIQYVVYVQYVWYSMHWNLCMVIQTWWQIRYSQTPIMPGYTTDVYGSSKKLTIYKLFMYKCCCCYTSCSSTSWNTPFFRYTFQTAAIIKKELLKLQALALNKQTKKWRKPKHSIHPSSSGWNPAWVVFTCEAFK